MPGFLNKIVLVMAAIFLSACGATWDDYMTAYSEGRLMPVNKKLLSYVKFFEKYNGHRISSAVVFSNKSIPEGSGAGCFTESKGLPGEVRIRTKYKHAESSLLAEIVFHELGHCELGLDHLSNLMRVDGEWRPVSMMWPDLSFHVPVSKNWSEYVRQLFDPEFRPQNMEQEAAFGSQREASRFFNTEGLSLLDGEVLAEDHIESPL